MKYINLPGTELESSEIILGCMRIHEVKNFSDVSRLINTALEEGINFFDHADIYGDGKSEEIFARVMDQNSISRDQILVQSKCGIRNGSFDFSREHILNSADGILKRLNTDYLDTLLLHRPDTLVEPEEVAEAFNSLHSSGKVRYFGVSNQNPMQIELLSKYLDQRIVINQLQLSLTNTGMIDSGLNVNMEIDRSINRDGGVLEYCRLKEITIQAWSPFLFGFFEGVFIDHPKFPELNEKMEELGRKYNASKNAIATAWIQRHPARMQTVAGSTNAGRLKEICKATDIELTRKEWYALYLSAGNRLP